MTLRKRLIALSMAAACAATAFAGAAFTDQSSIKVDGKVIDTLTEKNVIKGFEDGSFKPDTPVTRAQMAKMMFVLRTGSDDASYYAKDMTDTFLRIPSDYLVRQLRQVLSGVRHRFRQVEHGFCTECVCRRLTEARENAAGIQRSRCTEGWSDRCTVEGKCLEAGR